MAINEIDIYKEQYLDNWARLMVNFWIERMNAEMVGVSEKPDGSPRYSSGTLRRSFSVSLMKQSGGDTAKISHMFTHYGMYLDGAVFPGVLHRGVSLYRSGRDQTISRSSRSRSMYFFSGVRLASQ